MKLPDDLEQGFRIGEWEVVTGRHVLRRGDEEIAPEPKVWAVLMSLAKRRGDVVTRDELIDEVWDGRPTGDEPINRCISQLRKHLGDVRPYRYIKPVTGHGYLLQAEIEPLAGDEESAAAAPLPKARRRLWPYFAALALALLAVLFWPAGEPARDGAIRSIVVLPFENASGEPADRYLTAGFRDEFVRTLKRIDGFAVKTGQYEYLDETDDAIGELFGVDSVLRGTVQRSGSDVKAGYRVSRAATGEVVAADGVTGTLTNLFELQEKLASRVRDELFGSNEQKLVSASRPANFDAFDSYIQGTYAFERRGNGRNLEDAIRLFERTIELDPSFGPAYLQLATATALLPAYRGADIERSTALALEIVERGIEADDSIEDAAAAVRGFAYHNRKQWAEAEIAYRQATNADIVDPNAFNWYSRMLASVGRLDAALAQALEAVRIAPDSAVMNSRVALSYSWLGDTEMAQHYFDRARRLGAEGATHLLGYALFLAREGEIDRAREVARVAAARDGSPSDWIDAVLAGIEDPERAGEALAVVDRTAEAGQLSSQIEIVVRTLLGDIGGAMRIAQRLRLPGEAFEMDLLWIPEFLPVRQHPDFLPLMQDIGVAGYWVLKGCSFEPARVVCPDTT